MKNYNYERLIGYYFKTSSIYNVYRILKAMQWELQSCTVYVYINIIYTHTYYLIHDTCTHTHTHLKMHDKVVPLFQHSLTSIYINLVNYEFMLRNTLKKCLLFGLTVYKKIFICHSQIDSVSRCNKTQITYINSKNRNFIIP